LRREEVALLGGVSLEWYTRLEQGRDIHVSAHVLESLARALQLDANERTYLFVLTRNSPPPAETFSPPLVSPTFQQLLHQLGNIPACAFDARLNIVAWNAASRIVFGDLAAQSERERNMIWRIFTFPMQRRGNEWEEMARISLAQFRAGYGRFIEDPWWAAQIAELSRISPEFCELWARHDVRSAPEGRKMMLHPLVGELSFDLLSLQTVDASDLRVMMFSPRSRSGTAEKITRLLDAGI
jgi:transcriptional regulator with XRE-family HTH domain